MLEAGKIFSAIIIITVPIVYSDAYTLDWHIAIKIALWVALLIDYVFVFHILDKACETNDKVKVNMKSNKNWNETDSSSEFFIGNAPKINIEKNHQITIDELLEEK